MKRATAIIAAALLLLQAEAATSAPTTTRCHSVRVAVALAPGEPADRPLVGELCRPPGARSLQVLLSGATYGRAY